MNEEMRLAYSPTQVAKLLGLSRGFVYQQISKNNIPHLKIGSRVLIPAKELELWLDKNTIATTKET